MQPKTTIKDVAAYADVSIATVSRVLNNTAFVVPETRNKVNVAIETLGFIPKPAARMLAGGKTQTLGLLVPEISGDFFVPMLRGMEQAARELGYDLLIQTTAYRPLDVNRRLLGSHNTDGLLLFTDSLNDEAIRALETTGFPAVLLYRNAPPGSLYPGVTVENRHGAYSAVTHLVETHGKRKILFLEGPAGNFDGEERKRGYREALEAHAIEFNRERVLPGAFSEECAQAAVRDAVRKRLVFDAVFAADDESAMGALAALRKEGIRVPEDVAVVGFDDTSAASRSAPSLTTVRAPTERVGTEAVRLLTRLIKGKKDGLSVELPTELIPRESCGCGEGPGRSSVS